MMQISGANPSRNQSIQTQDEREDCRVANLDSERTDCNGGCRVFAGLNLPSPRHTKGHNDHH